jgi:hypothetical protein
MSRLVRIQATPDALARGVAGCVGEVLGWSVPSASGVHPIVGSVPSDVVLGVVITMPWNG